MINLGAKNGSVARNGLIMQGTSPIEIVRHALDRHAVHLVLPAYCPVQCLPFSAHSVSCFNIPINRRIC